MTLSELRVLVRLTLASAAAWPDATLDRWIGAAIRLYSAHCPRRLRAVVELAAAGTQAYAISGGLDARGVISVQYPAGQAPPRFLRQVLESSALFGAGARRLRFGVSPATPRRVSERSSSPKRWRMAAGACQGSPPPLQCPCCRSGERTYR